MKRERISYYDPPDWKWHERHSPGIQKAWKRDVDLDDRQFEVGMSGRNGARVVAYDLPYAETWGYAGHLFEYVDGRWTQKHAPPPRTILRLGGLA